MDSAAVIPYDDDVLYDAAIYSHTRASTLRRLRDTYLGRAVLHPLHGVALVALVSITAMAGGFGAFLLGLALLEGFIVLGAPRSRKLRAHVDHERREAEQRRIGELRVVMLNRMREADRIEYLRLDRLAAAIRARVGGESSISNRALEDHMRLERLLMLYMRIAVSVSESERLLGLNASTMSRSDDDDDADPALADTPRVRALRDRRRTVASLRAAASMENGESLAALRAELDLIAELVTLLFERTARPVGTSDIDEEIDRFVSDLERADPLVRELVELRALRPSLAFND